MASLIQFSRLIDRLSEFVGRWVSWLVLAAVLISAANAVVRKAFDTSSNAFLEIQHYPEPAGRGDPGEHGPQDFGIRHFALDVSDIEAEVERLEAGGMRFPAPVQQPSARIKSIYGRDPDGNIVEIQEILQANSPLAL